MNTHETLKNINSLIWYKSKYQSDLTWFYEELGISIIYRRYINEIEIIFDPEFMEKLVKYYDNKTLLWPKRIYEQLWLNLLNWNLHDPTSYIANLLGLWTDKN